ncbi:MAG: hypothetical protein S4CHLAM45_11450 [Chlamydiales bacterium]|nr:hypothetical protein [Chlamydiales bacterium]MCH9619637.1 hypothetical protein [Chlamydiales bacterium]MCH9623243.1 hypothetical protein [Chlamydiales bacterium]
MKKKTFQSIFEEVNGTPLEFSQAEEEGETFGLTDEMDHAILMQRDAHFGGDFALMLDYYQDENHIGIDPSFDLERIQYLYEVERETGNNLAAMLLTASEMEQIARCRTAYAKLKEVYELEDSPQMKIPRLIADLILTEEDEPLHEIEEVVLLKENIVPDLIQIITSDDAYDPLFPGYGYAPYLAAICLGKIGDSTALIPLFEMFGREMLFEEDILLDVFAEMGEKAKHFLLNRLKGRPLTNDNENAAFALSTFIPDPEVKSAALAELENDDVQKAPMLINYLQCLCEA